MYRLLIVLLLFTSCSTIKKTKQVKQEDKTELVQDTVLLNAIHRQLYTQTNQTSQEEIIKAVISALKIQFEGQSVDDKLILDLTQRVDGLSFAVSGVGKANYERTDTINYELEYIKILNRQDSIHNVQMDYYRNLEHLLKHSLKEKDKDEMQKGLEWKLYVFILVLAVVLFVLNRLLNAIKM